MSISYTVHVGPVIIIQDIENDPGCLDMLEVEDRIFEARAEMRDGNTRYFISDTGMYGISVEPKYDSETPPLIIKRDDIPEEMTDFERDHKKEIEWLRGKFPGARVYCEIMFLMDAR